tara:strand:+ start:175 stop:330 length:156 start_codon:yes stop_codon:yes gene_type:complete
MGEMHVKGVVVLLKAYEEWGHPFPGEPGVPVDPPAIRAFEEETDGEVVSVP